MSRPIVVMGPSACGKSTLGPLLAEALGRPFVEGDDLHPPANRERMANGQALTDEDRIPFLDAVARALSDSAAPVVSCSALKRAYRDRLRARVPGAVFVHPWVPHGELARRITGRSGHFMPASLLEDQLAVLEPLAPDETGLTVDGLAKPARQLAQVMEWHAYLR